MMETCLRSLPRRSNFAFQAIDGIFCAAESGFENIGIDFIIGMPGNTLENIKMGIRDRLKMGSAWLKGLSGLSVSK